MSRPWKDFATFFLIFFYKKQKTDLTWYYCIFKSCILPICGHVLYSTSYCKYRTRGLGWRMSTTPKNTVNALLNLGAEISYSKMCQMRIVDKILQFGVQVIWVLYNTWTYQPWGMGSRMSDYCRKTYPEPLDDHHSTLFDDEIFPRFTPSTRPGAFQTLTFFPIQNETCLMTLCKSTNNGDFQNRKKKKKEEELCTGGSQRVHNLLGAYLERTKVIIASPPHPPPHRLTW